MRHFFIRAETGKNASRKKEEVDADKQPRLLLRWWHRIGMRG